MMQGNVVMLHLLLRVPIGAQSFTEAVGEFVIDTGFTGHLLMPTEEVEILKLPFVEDAIHILADGQNVLLKKYTAVIQWDGQEKAVKVIAGGDRRLLGTRLLEGYDVLAEFVENGTVRLTPHGSA